MAGAPGCAQPFRVAGWGLSEIVPPRSNAGSLT